VSDTSFADGYTIIIGDTSKPFIIYVLLPLLEFVTECNALRIANVVIFFDSVFVLMLERSFSHNC